MNRIHAITIMPHPYHCLVDIRDLEYFLACCKARSFTAAARKVHIVQSAMSFAIARLEQDLGASLFDRTVTPIAPGRLQSRSLSSCLA